MANRRMFSLSVVGSDQFLDMSSATRELYFQLGMYADDDGFVTPKKIQRLCGASTDDINVLVAKRFIIPFETGVIVLRHWNENNYIQKDRYKPTLFTHERTRLTIGEDHVYILDTECTPRLGKDSIGKDTITAEADFVISKEIPEKVTTKSANAEYEEGLQWAEERAGRKFINRVKQYAALKKAKAAGIDNTKLMKRWKELEKEPFYQEHGLDWAMVLSSFDKRI